MSPNLQADAADQGTIASLLLSFDGRISRLPFWIVIIGFGGLSFIVEPVIKRYLGEIASIIFALIALYPMLAAAAKRAHDRGRSEMTLLAVLIPALAISALQLAGHLDPKGTMAWVMGGLGLWLIAAMIWMLIDLGLLRGELGANRFGADPLSAKPR